MGVEASAWARADDNDGILRLPTPTTSIGSSGRKAPSTYDDAAAAAQMARTQRRLWWHRPCSGVDGHGEATGGKSVRPWTEAAMGDEDVWCGTCSRWMLERSSRTLYSISCSRKQHPTVDEVPHRWYQRRWRRHVGLRRLPRWSDGEQRKQGGRSVDV